MTDVVITGMLDDDRPLPPSVDLNTFSDGENVIGIHLEESTYTGAVGNIDPSEWAMTLDDQILPEIIPEIPETKEEPPVNHLDTPVIGFNQVATRLGTTIGEMVNAGEKVTLQKTLDKVVEKTTSQSLVNLVEQGLIDVANMHQGNQFGEFIKQVNPAFAKYARVNNTVPDMQVGVKIEYLKVDVDINTAERKETLIKAQEMNANLETFHFYFPEIDQLALKREDIQEDAQFETKNGTEQITIMKRLGQAEGYINRAGVIMPLTEFTSKQSRFNSQVAQRRVFETKVKDYVDGIILNSEHQSITVAKNNVIQHRAPNLNMAQSDLSYTHEDDSNADYIDVLEHPELDVVFAENRPRKWLPTTNELIGMGLNIGEKSNDLIRITYEPLVQHDLPRHEHIVRTLSVQDAIGLQGAKTLAIKDSENPNFNTDAHLELKMKDGSNKTLKVHYNRTAPKVSPALDYQTSVVGRDVIDRTQLEKVSPTIHNPEYKLLANKTAKSLLDLSGVKQATRINRLSKDTRPVSYFGAKVLPEIIGKPNANLLPFMLTDLAYGHYTVQNSVEEIVSTKKIKTVAIEKSPIYKGNATSPVKTFSIPEHMLNSHLTGFITNDTVFKDEALAKLKTDDWEKKFTANTIGFSGIRFSPYNFSQTNQEGNKLPEEWTVLQDVPLNYHYLRRKDSFFNHPAIAMDVSEIIGKEKAQDFAHFGNHRQPSYISTTDGAHHARLLNNVPYYNVKDSKKTIGQALFQNLANELKLTPDWSFVEFDGTVNNDLDTARVGVKYKNDIATDFIHPSSWLRARHINQHTPHIKVKHPNGLVYMYRNISAKYPQMDIRFSNKDLLSKMVSGIGLNARRKKTKPGEYNYGHPFTTLKRNTLDTWLFANTYLKKADTSAIIGLINAPNKYFDRYMQVYGNGIVEIEEGAFGNAENFLGEMVQQFANDIRGRFVLPGAKSLVRMLLSDSAKTSYSIPTRDRRYLEYSSGKAKFQQYQHPDAASMIPAGLLNFVFDEANKDNEDVKLIRYMLDRDNTNMYKNDFTYALDFLHEHTYQKLPEVIKFNDEPETGFLNYENLPNTALRDSKIVYDTPNKHQSMRLANFKEGLDVAVNAITPVRIGAVKTITKDSKNPDLNSSFITGYVKPHILESIAVNLKSRRDYLMRGIFRSPTGIYKEPHYHTSNTSQDYQIKHPLQSDKGFMELNLTIREVDLHHVLEKIGAGIKLDLINPDESNSQGRHFSLSTAEMNEKGNVSVENITSAYQSIVKDYIKETTGWDADAFNVSIVSTQEREQVVQEFGLQGKQITDLTGLSKQVTKFLEDVPKEDADFAGNNVAGIIFGIGLVHDKPKSVYESGVSGRKLTRGFYDKEFDKEFTPVQNERFQHPTTRANEFHNWKYTGVRKLRSILIKVDANNDKHVYGQAYILLKINIGDSVNNIVKISEMGSTGKYGVGTDIYRFPLAGMIGHARGIKSVASLDDFHTLINYDDPFINETTRHRQVPSIVYKHLSPLAKTYLVQRPEYSFEKTAHEFRIPATYRYKIVTGKMPTAGNEYVSGSNSMYSYSSGYYDEQTGSWVYPEPPKDIVPIDYETKFFSTRSFSGGELALIDYPYKPRRHMEPMPYADYQPGVMFGKRYLYGYNYNESLQFPILLSSPKAEEKTEGDTIVFGTQKIDEKPKKPEDMIIRILDDKYYYDDKHVSPADFMRLSSLNIMDTKGLIDVIRKAHEYELKKSFMTGRYITKVRPYDETVTLPDMTVLFLETKFSPWLKSIGYFHVSKVFDTRHLFSEIKTPTAELIPKYELASFNNTYLWFDLPEYMNLFTQLFSTQMSQNELAALTETDGKYLFDILRNNYSEEAENGSSFIYPDIAPVLLEYDREKIPSFDFIVTHNMSKMQAERITKYGLKDMDKNPYIYADMWKTYSNTPTLTDLEVRVEEGQTFAPGFQGMITPIIRSTTYNRYENIAAWPNIDRNHEFDKFKVALDIFGHERVVMVTNERLNSGDDLLYITNKDDYKRIMTVGANSRINYLNCLVRHTDAKFAKLPEVDETHLATMVNENKTLNVTFSLVPAANHPMYIGKGEVTYRSPRTTEVKNGIPPGINIYIPEGYSDNIWLNTTMTDFRALLAQGSIDMMIDHHKGWMDFVGQKENFLTDPNFTSPNSFNHMVLHKYRHVSDHMLPWLMPGLFIAEDANYKVLDRYIDEINKEFGPAKSPEHKLHWSKDFLRFFNPGYQTGGTPFVTLNFQHLKSLLGFTVDNGHFARRAVKGSQVSWHLNDLVGKYHGAALYARLVNREKDIVTGSLRGIPNPYPNKYRNFAMDDAGKIFEIFEDGSVNLYMSPGVGSFIRNNGDERRIPFACNMGEWDIGKLNNWKRRVRKASRTDGISSVFDQIPRNMTESEMIAIMRRINENANRNNRAQVLDYGDGFAQPLERMQHDQGPAYKDLNYPILNYMEHRREGGGTHFDKRTHDSLYYYDNSMPLGEMALDMLARCDDPRKPGVISMVPSLLGLHNFETLRDYRFSRVTYNISSYFNPHGGNASRTTTTYRLSPRFIDALLSGKMINPIYEVVDQTRNEDVFDTPTPTTFDTSAVQSLVAKIKASPRTSPVLLPTRVCPVTTCNHSVAQAKDDDKRYNEGYESVVGEFSTIHSWKAYRKPGEKQNAKIHSRKVWLMPAFIHQLTPLTEQDEYEAQHEPNIIIHGELPNMGGYRMYTGRRTRPWKRVPNLIAQYGPGRANLEITTARDFKKTALEPMPTRGFYAELNYAYHTTDDILTHEQNRLGEAYSTDAVKELVQALNNTEEVKGVRPKYPLHGLEERLGLDLN